MINGNKFYFVWIVGLWGGTRDLGKRGAVGVDL
jgi:hypothetical protein